MATTTTTYLKSAKKIFVMLNNGVYRQ